MRHLEHIVVSAGLALCIGLALASAARGQDHAGHGQAPSKAAHGPPASTRITHGGAPRRRRCSAGLALHAARRRAGRRAAGLRRRSSATRVTRSRASSFPLQPGESATAGPELTGMGGPSSCRVSGRVDRESERGPRRRPRLYRRRRPLHHARVSRHDPGPARQPGRLSQDARRVPRRYTRTSSRASDSSAATASGSSTRRRRRRTTCTTGTGPWRCRRPRAGCWSSSPTPSPDNPSRYTPVKARDRGARASRPRPSTLSPSLGTGGLSSTGPTSCSARARAGSRSSIGPTTMQLGPGAPRGPEAAADGGVRLEVSRVLRRRARRSRSLAAAPWPCDAWPRPWPKLTRCWCDRSRPAARR